MSKVPANRLKQLAYDWEDKDWESQEANLAARECAKELRERIKTYE